MAGDAYGGRLHGDRYHTDLVSRHAKRGSGSVALCYSLNCAVQNTRAADTPPAPAQPSVAEDTACQNSVRGEAPVAQVAGLRRWLFVALGGVFVALGLVGVALPGIPTTPFLLLASYFFVRSSPALHQRLLRSKLFGPTLQDWQRHRGVKRKTKWASIVCCSLMIGLSIATGGLPGWGVL